MFQESENLEARRTSNTPLSFESFIPRITRDELLRAAANPALTEDLALSMLQQADLPVEAIERLAENGNLLKLRKVKLALASHPYAPRRLSISLLRQCYTFDLMKLSLTPGVPADVKVAAEDALISRLKTITLGERLALARRGSGRIAGAMLLDRNARVMQIALENPRLTEITVVQAVLRPGAPIALVHAVARHPKWSLRREVRASTQ